MPLSACSQGSFKSGIDIGWIFGYGSGNTKEVVRDGPGTRQNGVRGIRTRPCSAATVCVGPSRTCGSTLSTASSSNDSESNMRKKDRNFAAVSFFSKGLPHLLHPRMHTAALFHNLQRV